MHSAEISLTAVYPVGLHILRELALPLRPKIIMLFLGHDDDSTVRNTKSPSPSVIAERGGKLVQDVLVEHSILTLLQHHVR